MIMNNPWLIGIVTTLIGIIGGFLLSGRRKKVLAWKVEFEQALVSQTGTDDRIKILFDEQEVQEPHIIIVKFVNSGTIEIKESDFRLPTKLDFGAKVLQTSWVFDPPLKVTGKPHSDNCLALDPLLLNRGESFRVMVYTDQKPTFSCIGRIAGGQIRELQRGNAGRTIILGLLNITLGLVSFALVFWMLNGGTHGVFFGAMMDMYTALVAWLASAVVVFGATFLTTKYSQWRKRRL